jgi:hypothetical protein
MADWLLPIVFAIFIWWFSTGVVILLDGLPHRTFRWSLVISSALAIGALMGLAHTADQTTVAGAYCAFTCALLLWGWHEPGHARRATRRVVRGGAMPGRPCRSSCGTSCGCCFP